MLLWKEINNGGGIDFEGEIHVFIFEENHWLQIENNKRNGWGL